MGSKAGDGMEAVRAVIRGRVQGVSFRWYTQEEATRLGLVGWVRNLPDGSVELWAEGERPTLEALLRWCAKGPPAARVTGIDTEWSAPVGGTGFAIRH
jgi:acylphosphatase